MVVALTLKIDACSGEIPLISIENTHYYCDFNRGQTDLVDVLGMLDSSLIDAFTLRTENFQIQKLIVCATFKVSNGKNCCDPDCLENEVKDVQ